MQTDLNEICRYTSGTFNDAETRYSTNEKELLAIVRGIRKFSAFLLPKSFVIRSDNTQVSGLIFNKLPSEPQYRRLHRWQVLLSFYSFKIEYIKGLETDLLLGNDFLQQFQDYHQTLYMISLKTPCGHFIKVPRKQNPYNLEKDNGSFKRKYLENLRKITCKCLNLEKIKDE